MKTPSRKYKSMLSVERLEQRAMFAGLTDEAPQGIAIGDVDSPEITVEISIRDAGVVQAPQVTPATSHQEIQITDSNGSQKLSGVWFDFETGRPIPQTTQDGQTQPAQPDASSSHSTMKFGIIQVGQFGGFSDSDEKPDESAPQESADDDETDAAIQSLYQDVFSYGAELGDRPQRLNSWRESKVFRAFEPSNDSGHSPESPVVPFDSVPFQSPLSAESNEGNTTKPSVGVSGEKLKSPQVDPFAGQEGLLKAGFDFFDGFNEEPVGMAAYLTTFGMVPYEGLPYKPVRALSDNNLGRLAAGLIWLQSRHPDSADLDVLRHYVRLEIHRRFGPSVLPRY